MLFQEYVDVNSKTKSGVVKKSVPQAINQRWQSRIVANGWHELGAEGAHSYYETYGAKTGATKMLQFALKAGFEGRPEMSQYFWKQAYRKAGHLGEITYMGSDIVKQEEEQVIEKEATPFFPDLPPHMQPTKFDPMQPTDAPEPAEYFINNGNFWAQAKHDGIKTIAFVSPDQVVIQSRSMKIRALPFQDIKDALQQVAAIRNESFVIEGELTFISSDGIEHRTLANAQGHNTKNLNTRVKPTVQFRIFSRVDIVGNYGHMVEAGSDIAFEAYEHCPRIRMTTTYKNSSDKRLLHFNQKVDQREGVIWFNPLMRYVPGKDKKHPFYRTKFLTDTVYTIKGLTETTAEGRLFGAISIVDENNKDMGNIGTGFDVTVQGEIYRAFQEGIKMEELVKIRCTHQGYVWPSGKPWHTRVAKPEWRVS